MEPSGLERRRVGQDGLRRMLERLRKIGFFRLGRENILREALSMQGARRIPSQIVRFE